MTSNASVRRFKTDMTELVNRAKQNFRQTTLAQADELIENMRAAIEHNVTGHLSESLRKKDVTNSDETKISVLVLAGGPLTTKRTSAGNMHDYSLDEEFGNVKQQAKPFFYSTYRLYKKNGLEQYRETLAETIEENNRVRGLRSQNYSNASSTRSVGHRGAVVIHK